MQATDDVIWQLIHHGFCSFKAKIETNTFCRNKYNATGLCNRTSCPLANGRYATIMERDGVCYLCIKTVERSQTPNEWWEEIKLPNSYKQALEKIDEHLPYWPQRIIHRCKQRLTKIWQYLLRMRRLRKKVRPKLVSINTKVERRERIRERKALVAANIENQIKKELLERLKQGTYGEIYNFNQQAFDEVMNEKGIEDEMNDEFVEYEEDEDLEDLMKENEEEDDASVQSIGEDFDDLDDDEDDEEQFDDEEGEESADEDSEPRAESDEEGSDDKPAPRQPKKRAAPTSKAAPQAKRRKRPHINIELEEEDERATSVHRH